MRDYAVGASDIFFNRLIPFMLGKVFHDVKGFVCLRICFRLQRPRFQISERVEKEMVERVRILVSAGSGLNPTPQEETPCSGRTSKNILLLLPQTSAFKHCLREKRVKNLLRFLTSFNLHHYTCG